jgi:hypothetical protein
MKCFQSFLPMAVCLATAALVVSPSCSSGPDVKDTVDSMGTFGTETAKVKDSIDHTLQALNALVATQASDLKVPFDAYTKSVTALDAQAQVIRARADEMKTTGDDFFAQWEADSSTEVSPERRAQLSASYGRIKEDMAEAGMTFTPFLASLKDIQSLLKMDLTVTGINSVGELVKKANSDGAQVKSNIEAVLTQLNSVRGMLSTKPAN